MHLWFSPLQELCGRFPSSGAIVLCKPLESELGGDAANSDDPLFLKQLLRQRTDMPTPLVQGAAIC